MTTQDGRAIEKRRAIRLALSVWGLLFGIGIMAATAHGEGYVVDVRKPVDGTIITIPFDENLEVHKGFDAVLRYPMEFEDCTPSAWEESGIGLMLELTEVECDGENMSFTCDFSYAEVYEWQANPYPGLNFWSSPCFRMKSTKFKMPPRKLGEWIEFGSAFKDGESSEPAALRIRKVDSFPEENE